MVVRAIGSCLNRVGHDFGARAFVVAHPCREVRPSRMGTRLTDIGGQIRGTRPCAWGNLLVDEVYFWFDGDDAFFVPESEQAADGFLSVGAVAEGALIDVHADEAAGQVDVEVACELHGVFEALFAVVEAVLDAVAEGLGGDAHHIGAEAAADGVAAEGKHEAGLFAPPDAEIDDFAEAAGGVGELPLVDDEAGVEAAGFDFGDDLVEGDDFGFDVGVEDFERKIRW